MIFPDKLKYRYKIPAEDIRDLSEEELFCRIAEHTETDDNNFWRIKDLLKGKNYKKKVTVQKGESTARYDLVNALWRPENVEKEIVRSFTGAREAVFDVLCYNCGGKTWKTKGAVNRAIDKVANTIIQAYETRCFYSVEKSDVIEEDLPYVSKIPRRKKRQAKAETAFFKKLKKDVTMVGRGLRQDPLGKKVLAFVRDFYKAAKSVSLGRFLGTGFIFSFSHSKFCEKYGYKKTECNRLLNLAAGLGLITKITPVAARGIGEYWHKKFGVGILQFMLKTVNVPRALFRWYRWKANKIKVKEITVKKIERVLGVDITTHPEATDYELRKIILDANKKAEEEKALTEKESLDIRSFITEDPLDIGHKGKKYDIIPDRKYTATDAEKLLADIIKDHNDHSVNAWLNFEKEFSERTLITYKTKIRGRYVKYRKKKISELPMKLMIPEQYWMTARKPAKALISELYNQGLVGIITKSSLISEQYDWTYSYFIQTVSSIPRRRKLW